MNDATCESTHHNSSQCSTHLRDGDLADGSLSYFPSDEAGGSLSDGCKARQPIGPMILLQLKRLAPKEGRFQVDCRRRVPQSDRHYELLVEPHVVHWADPGGPEPWQSDLRGKRKVRLRPVFRSAPPLQLVPHCRPLSKPTLPRPKKARPVLKPLKPREDGLAAAPVSDVMPGVSLEPHLEDEDTSRPSTELELPSTLIEDRGVNPADEMSPRSKELVHWSATWPLGNQTNVPVDMSATLSMSSSGGNKSTSMREFSHRYSVRRLSDRRRSWLKAEIENNKAKNQGPLSHRHQLREMVSIMMKTMTQTFDRSVWHACDVLHPDEELEIAHARQKKVLEDQIDQFKGLRIGQALLKGTRRQSRRESVRRSFGITAGTFSITPPGFEKPDEKVLAHLAKQTNWSILDVEEVWEVFAVHAPTGRIGVQSNEFVQLLQELYRGVTDEEIMLLQQHIKAVRTRNQARSRFMRKALAGMDATQDRSDVRFSEFYVALVKWLNLQTARVEACRQADPRCSLSRYQQSAMGSAPESVPGSEATFSGGWDDYRKLKQEVDDSLRGPHQRGQGIANAVLVQKQRQSQSDQLYQLLSQDSESEDTEERNDTDEEQQDFRLTRSSTSSAGHTLDVTGFL